MSSVISSETYNNIKTLSKEYKITNSFAKPSKTKQVLRSQLSELVRKLNTPANSALSDQLETWLRSQPASSLFPIFSTQNSLICAFLIQMNLKILSDGNFDFALVENPEKKIHEFDVNKLFYMRKGVREEKIMTKKEFEGCLRFVDTDDYLDTLIIEPKVLRNIDKLLELFDFITSEAAFKVPCMVYWDSNLKKWMQEYPAWHRHSQFFNLAQWACAALEREVWLKFFIMNNIDPRGPGESTLYVSECKILNSVEMVQSLPEFLRSLGKNCKEDLIGDHLTIKTIFDDVKEKLRNFRSDHFSHREVCFIPNHIDSSMNYKDSNIIETFLGIVKNHSEEVLVEYLLCTPLARTLSAFDLTLRIISLKVKEMYTKKMAEELMNEGVQESKKPKKTKKRRKKNAKNKEIIENNETQPDGKEFTNSIVKNIMKEMYEFIEAKETAQDKTTESIQPVQEIKSEALLTTEISSKFNANMLNHIPADDSEFKIVNQKKKPRKTQQDLKSYHISSRPKPTNRQPVHKPLTPPPSQSTSKQTSKSSWQTPSHPIKSSVDPIAFPPLFSSFNQNSSALHEEIIHFVSSHLSSLSKKYQALSLIRDQIKSLVETHFAGSLFVYGSYATGLAVEESDIDLAVSCQEELTREEVIKNCLYLAEVLSDEDFVKTISPIVTASVPLVKIEANLCPGESVPIIGSIDITFVNKVEIGDSLLKVNEYMQELQRNWPLLHPLALFLKAFLYHHGLNSVYSGGLSSYSLLIWIAAYLQFFEVKAEDIGEALLGFLRFFGNEFNPLVTAVQVQGKQSFFILQSPVDYALTVDPINSKNNTTRGSFRITEVLKHFSFLHVKLRELNEKKKIRGFIKDAFNLV